MKKVTGNIVQATIEYSGIKINVEASAELIHAVDEELSPFFHMIILSNSRILEADSPHITIFVHSTILDSVKITGGETIAVDTSLYSHLASSGTRWGDESIWTVHIDLTASWFCFDKLNQRVDLYQPDHKLQVVDTVRLIKSITTTAVENLGAVQIHAAAAVLEGGDGLVVAGDMWQGKTTLLLELLSKFKIRQLSCDTVVMRPLDNYTFDVCGWPSPFSMSHGSMSDHPQLLSFIPPQRQSLPYSQLWADRTKTVLTSKQIVELFETELQPTTRRLSTILFARFRPHEVTSVTKITDEEELIKLFQEVYLGSRDPIYHNWHRYQVTSNATIDENIQRLARQVLDNIDVRLFTWAPSAESLLKTIPQIARAHRTADLLARSEGHKE